MASSIYHFDIAESDGHGSEYDWGWSFPPAFRSRYDRDFFLHMLALIVSLWERMERGAFTVPSCTAEEILLGDILAGYSMRLDSAELQPGYVDLDDIWLPDDDYLLLYNSEIAGRDDVLAALENQLATTNLDFDSWFEPFYDSLQVAEPISELELDKINGVP